MFQTNHLYNTLKENQIYYSLDEVLSQLNVFPSKYRKPLKEIVRENPHLWLKWKTKKGKLTTRLAKELYKRTGEKPYFGGFGEALGRTRSPRQRFFTIEQELDWEHGDFADNGSCWCHHCSYPDYPIRVGFFNSGQGYAVKFFKDEIAYEWTSRKGIGRCWLWKEEKALFIFNATGLSLESIANTMSCALDLKKFRSTFHLYLRSRDGSRRGQYQTGQSHFCLTSSRTYARKSLEVIVT